MKSNLLLFIFIFCAYFQSQGQLHDSLKKKLNEIYKIKELKTRASELEKFTRKNLFQDIPTGLKNSTELISLSKKLKNDTLLAKSYNFRGLAENYSENSSVALNYFDSCKKISLKINDSVLLAKAYGNSGIAFERKNDFQKAYSEYISGLKISEKLNKKDMQGNTLGNLGNVLIRLEREKDAIKYLEKAIEIFSELNMQIPLANQYNSISQAYDELKDRKKQRFYLEKAIEIYERENDYFHLGTALTNLSTLEYIEKNFEKSLKLIRKAILIEKSIGDQVGLATLYTNLIDLNIKSKNYKEALEAVDTAYTFANKLNDVFLLFNIKRNHAVALTNFKRFEEAYDLMSDAVGMLDTISGVAAQKAVAEFQEKFEAEKKQFEIDKLQKNKKITALELEQNKNTIAKQEAQRNLIVGVLFSVLIVLGLLFQSFRQKKKSNQQLSLAFNEIKIQKEEISEKNKEILDSIYYAQRIQKTLLTNSEFISQHLKNHFLFFQPKDIVSGDFYWATYTKGIDDSSGRFYLAVCDCTGHGVPGAFMSLLNISFLNEAINEKNIIEPHKIFNFVRERLIAQISSDGQKDGMDGILLCFDTINNKITYAAANNAPVLISNGICTELEYDKMPVGKGEKDLSFTCFELNFQKGDAIYLYTDGYADQFGGPKGKKFKYKPLNQLLVQHSGEKMPQQLENLKTNFESWKGKLEQVDDVTVIGLQL